MKFFSIFFLYHSFIHSIAGLFCGVKSLLLKRGGKILLLVCGWNKNLADIDATVNTGALKFVPASAVDIESRENFPVKDGKFSFPLEGYGVRLIEME